ncbi:MAG: ParA family protein [Blastocatellia bacterium]|nr:ParA family protein [Blastocatellia bacterium]
MKPTKGKTIAVFNQSGGVAKTTLTRDLGYELAIRGLKILLIDADPQGTLGEFFGEKPNSKTVEEMFWTKVCRPEYTKRDVPTIIHSRFGLDVGLANRNLTNDEIFLSTQRDPGRMLSVIDTLRPSYDVILIDCSPKISEIIVQTLTAVDGLLIPVQTEGKSMSAFAEVQVEITKTQARRENLRIDPLEIVGVVPTLYSPTKNLHRHHLQELKGHCERFGIEILGTFRDYIAVAEAGTQKKPLQLHAPTCPAVEDIKQITSVFLKKSGLHMREVKHG